MRSCSLSTVALLGALASSVSADVSPQSFVSTSLNAPFLEQFNDSWESRWSASSAVKQTPVGGETFSYVGVWSVEEPTVFPGIPGDKGLVIKSKAAHHAISAEILPAIKIEDGKPLVVQYETKLQKGLECGGAYVKLLSEGEGDLSAAEFSDKTPFTIMFGPDKCGATNKVHFIFKHLNPKTGEYEEKHLTAAPSPKITKLSALYTLIVNPDNTFEILINDVSAKTGSLLEDFEPAVNPAKEIDDPEDSKPSTWVDEAKIVDPEATKPEEWNEDAPALIVDTEATIPEGWLENEPDIVADPDAEKPEEWDDEEDGDWIAPSVSNPACEDAPGCGPWSQPLISNPEYKGQWSAPLIDNPEYKGIWAPQKIANPDYFEDLEPAKGLTAIGGIGFEIWTMTEDMLFDNIYIGHSVADAKALAAETFHVKYEIEKAAEKAALDEDDDELVGGNKAARWQDLVVSKYEEGVELAYEFIEHAKTKGARSAVEEYPSVAGTFLVSLMTLLGSIGALITYYVVEDQNAPAPAPAVVPKKVTPVPAALPAVVGSSAEATPVVEVTTTKEGETVPVQEALLKQRKGKGKD